VAGAAKKTNALCPVLIDRFIRSQTLWEVVCFTGCWLVNDSTACWWQTKGSTNAPYRPFSWPRGWNQCKRRAPFQFQQICQFIFLAPGNAPVPPHQMWEFCVLKSSIGPFQLHQVWKFNFSWNPVCPLSLQIDFEIHFYWYPDLPHFLNNKFCNSLFLQCGHAQFPAELILKFTLFSKIGWSRLNPKVVAKSGSSRFNPNFSCRKLGWTGRPLPFNVSGNLDFGARELLFPDSCFHLIICTRNWRS